MGEKKHNFALERLRAALEKRAGFWDSFKKSLSTSRMGEQAGEALLNAGAQAAFTGLGEAARSGYHALKDRVDKPKAFAAMLDAAPGLKKMDQKGVQMTFNTLYTLNREYAKDPLIASSFVSRQANRAEIEDGAHAFIEPSLLRSISPGPQGKSTDVFDAWSSGAAKSFKPHDTFKTPQEMLKREKEDALAAQGKQTKYNDQYRRSRGGRGNRRF
jgi:hypothetical protein